MAVGTDRSLTMVVVTQISAKNSEMFDESNVLLLDN